MKRFAPISFHEAKRRHTSFPKDNLWIMTSVFCLKDLYTQEETKYDTADFHNVWKQMLKSSVFNSLNSGFITIEMQKFKHMDAFRILSISFI